MNTPLTKTQSDDESVVYKSQFPQIPRPNAQKGEAWKTKFNHEETSDKSKLSNRSPKYQGHNRQKDTEELSQIGDVTTKCNCGMLAWILEHRKNISVKTGKVSISSVN